MIAQSSIYSKAAAARILGVAAHLIKEVRGAFNVILVVLKKARARFVSPKAFEADAVEFRIDGALALSGDVVPSDTHGFYLVRGSKGNWYEVDAIRSTCDCADFVYRSPGKCKHLHLLGAYLAAEQIVVTKQKPFSHADEVALLSEAAYFDTLASLGI